MDSGCARLWTQIREKSFLAPLTTIDAVRLQVSDSALTCFYTWKLKTAHLVAGVLFGPFLTSSIYWHMQERAMTVADLFERHGYYFVPVGMVMNAIGWGIAVHAVISDRYVRFDFAGGEVLFRYRGFRNLRCIVPLASVNSVETRQRIYKHPDTEDPTTFYTLELLSRISQMNPARTARDLRQTPENKGLLRTTCQCDRGTQWVTAKPRICGSVSTVV